MKPKKPKPKPSVQLKPAQPMSAKAIAARETERLKLSGRVQ
jgi:hypothetical protein